MKEPWGWREVELSHPLAGEPVPIVGDGMIGMDLAAEGRLIVVLILDTSRRPDIDQMVRAHRDLGPGDVVGIWVRPSRFSSKALRLVLNVTKPMACTVMMHFDLAAQAGVVDHIVATQGLYLQPGRPGDRLKRTLDADRVLVEVPSRRFRSEWDRMFIKVVRRRFRHAGLGRRDSLEAANEYVSEWRRLSAIRLGRSGQTS